MSRTITRMFDSRADAEVAIRELEARGVRSSDISIVSPSVAASEERSFSDRDRNAEERAKETAEDAGKGAAVGGVLGAGAGLLAGLGLIAIPGVGPVVAAGWLASTLAGLAVGGVAGGATGGIVGALTNAGVSDDDARVYAEGVRRGGTLVSARVEDAHAAAVEQVMSRGSSDASALGAEYRRGGWTGSDQTTRGPGGRQL